jgi:alkanesulfonate monooxygenase SsuD/methylene tetrahydromethanopterin reductase-like flavin-dependent oxidoreductase (luciferase family)
MRVDVLLEPDQTPAQLEALARSCERHGIGTMWLQNYAMRRDPFMSLVPAALATSRVGLGVCVVSPWEMHPVKMANSLLTLQECTPGRPAGLVIGGGGEWLARLGIEPVKRVRAVREAVELVGGACRAAAPFSYRGEIFRVWNYRAQFGGGTPPLVYAGANKPQMIQATVPGADGVMYSDMTRQMIGPAVARTRAALAARGRAEAGYRISNIWAWHIKPDPAVARREACRELLLRGLLGREYLESFLPPEDCDLVERHKKHFYEAYRSGSGNLQAVPRHLVDALIADLTFTGTPDAIEERIHELEAFRAAGVNELCLRLHDDPADAIRLIGERVIPRLAD